VAISLALADAGLKRSGLDGLLVTTGVSYGEGLATFTLRDSMRPMARMLADINAGNSSTGTATLAPLKQLPSAPPTWLRACSASELMPAAERVRFLSIPIESALSSV